MVNLKGRILEVPCVEYQSHPISVIDLQKGKWDLRGKAFAVTPATQITYCVLELIRPGREFIRDWEPRKFFKDNIARALSGCGLRSECFEHLAAESWHIVRLKLRIHENDSRSEDDDFEKIKGKLQKLKGEGVSIVLVLLPDKDANTYATLKRAGDIDVGIQTVCTVSGDSGPKTADDFYANLVMKFNLKAAEGTVNHMLDRGKRGPILDETTCILGMDVVRSDDAHLEQVRKNIALISYRRTQVQELSAGRRALQPLWQAKMTIFHIGRPA